MTAVNAKPVRFELLDIAETPNTAGVVVPTWQDGTLTIYTCALTPKDDGPDRRSVKTLVPSKDLRHLATAVKLIPLPFVLPLISTPPAMHSRKLEVLGYSFHDNGELFISVGSFNHSAVYLEHGAALARLHFVSTIRMD